MSRNRLASPLRSLTATLVAALVVPLVAPPLLGADLVEEFDGTTLDTAKWETFGGKTSVVGGGKLTWNADGGDWTSGEIDSRARFFLPPAGQTAKITWVLGPGSVTQTNTGSDGASIRYQVGIHSANETAGSRQHWANSSGGLWLDLDYIPPSNPFGCSGAIYSANDAKQSDSQGTWQAQVTLADWSWGSQNRELSLEFTDTDWSWYDGLTLIDSGTWEELGIDVEFSNGFRVMALGMNFNTGRGVTSLERIQVQNAGSPSALISAFGAVPAVVTSGQSLTLSWTIDAAASASIDPGVGNVDAQTSAGVGSISVTPAAVSQPTQVIYTLTVTKGQEQATRQLSVTVNPPPTFMYDDYVDDFNAPDLDLENWEPRGDATRTVEDGRVKWGANAGDWGHGEIDSTLVYPLPGPGKSTTIRWTLGPGSISRESTDASGNSIRYIVGVFSSYEKNNWSRQAWQNTTGGTWLDVNSGSGRPDGMSGGVVASNDTKPIDSGARWVADANIPDWDWQTDIHEVSLVITAFDFSWYDGTNLLATSTWDAEGIDSEFANGFKITAIGLNYADGRAFTSLEKVEVDNGAVANSFSQMLPVLTPGGVQLAWESVDRFTYDVLKATNAAGPWTTLQPNLPSQGETTTYTDTAATGTQGFYQIAGNPPPPLLATGFEPGQNLSGWTEVVQSGSGQWQVGTPTSGPGAAYAGVNVYATKLGGDYDEATTAGLRTPPIDLTGASSAVLTFQQWYEVEDGFDFAVVNVLDSTGTVLTEMSRQTGSSGGWVRRSVALPAEALGQVVRLEFLLLSDPFEPRAGWYLDDVLVE